MFIAHFFRTGSSADDDASVFCDACARKAMLTCGLYCKKMFSKGKVSAYGCEYCESKQMKSMSLAMSAMSEVHLFVYRLLARTLIIWGSESPIK